MFGIVSPDARRTWGSHAAFRRVSNASRAMAHRLAALRLAEMYDKSGLFIDGRWAAALGGRTTPVMSPVSEYPLGQVPLAGLAGTNAAIASVSAGFAAWKPKSGYEPADALHAIANELKRRTDKAAAMAGENFGPIAAITRFLATAAVAGFRKLTETAATQAGKGAH